MTVATALLQGTRLLEDEAIAVPRLTAEVLLAHAMRCERVYFYAHPEQELSEIEWLHYGRYLHERLKGKPTQYITGIQEFYGREFRVTPDVLIPRPETEHLIEAALRHAAPGAVVLDIGTGSGAIAATLALELSDPRVVAIDVRASLARGGGECGAGGRSSGIRRGLPGVGHSRSLDRHSGLEPALCTRRGSRRPAARGSRLRAPPCFVRRTDRS